MLGFDRLDLHAHTAAHGAFAQARDLSVALPVVAWLVERGAARLEGELAPHATLGFARTSWSTFAFSVTPRSHGAVYAGTVQLTTIAPGHTRLVVRGHIAHGANSDRARDRDAVETCVRSVLDRLTREIRDPKNAA
ncbi:MAG TPA: hypothetical protein VMD91_15830 [Candidatus Sulfotelmatobacter sp.]|nr:hypothetical protein [Candidatus Sulfotelmatobacter sp.]